MIDLNQLSQIMPNGGSRCALFLAPLNAAMGEYGINTPQREAAFLAQIAHESGELRYVRELASGDEYDTRTDLGNTPELDGDGARYKGRGLIQLTGKANYARLSKAWGIDLVARPELLETPAFAARSAAWFWQQAGCNQLADSNSFQLITRKINGGLNGYAQRVAYWETARRVLDTPAIQPLASSDISKSPEAWITGSTAVVGGGGAVSQLVDLSTNIQQVASAGYSVSGVIGSLKAILGSAALPWLLLILVSAIAGWLLWKHWRDLKTGKRI